VIWHNYYCQVKIWFNNNQEVLAICHYPR